MSDMVMIDLETLSTKHNAAIVSIGAVKFNNERIVNEFKINVSAESCKEHNLHIDINTINWWWSQSPEARKLWLTEPQSLKYALDSFINWYGRKSMYTWGFGANFDIVIMESAFHALDIKEPWKYTDIMCLRTVRNLNGIDIPRGEGTHHDALDDAKNQAKYLMRIMNGEPF